MVLSEEKIKQLIISPEHRADIEEAIRLQDEAKVHVTGEGYKDALARTMGKERSIEFGLTRELTEPVTKFLTKKIKDELSRWKNTQGTRKSYDFGDDKNKSEDFVKILTSVWKDNTIDSFAYWLNDAIYTDFNGFAMIEMPVRVGDLIVRDGIPGSKIDAPYIIFKSIEDIYDFKCNGRSIEYIIINYGVSVEVSGGVTVEHRLYRVIDDEFDAVYINRAGTVEPYANELPIKNKLKFVPAIQIGDILAHTLNDYIKVSPINQCQPHLNDYITRHAEHVSSEVQHAYPILAIKGSRCNYISPEGSACSKGKIKIGAKEANCPRCNGSGAVVIRNSSEVVMVPEVDKTGKAYDPSMIGQYIVPPTAILKHQSEELDSLENTIIYSGTGIAKALAKSSIQTATEIVLNIKPLEDKISSILDNIEFVETFLTDCIGKIVYDDSYKGCEVHYGRKLNIRDDNIILDEIEKSKRSGMPVSHIRTLLQELIATRNRNSKIDMERGFMLLDLEPMATYSIKEILDSEVVSLKTKCLKQYFDDYIDRFENENGSIVLYKTTSSYQDRIAEIGSILEGYNDEQLKFIDNGKSDKNRKDDQRGTQEGDAVLR